MVTRFIDTMFLSLFFRLCALVNQNNNINTPHNAPEATDRLISEKKSERYKEGQEAIQQSAEGIKSDVADVMAGMEAPKEGISERKGESGEKGDIRGGGGQAQTSDDQNQPVGSFVVKRGLPNEEIMIKKIRSAINEQIKQELKKAKVLEKNLAFGSAHEYGKAMAKIRQLQESLKSLFESTFEKIKEMYFKYFSSEGRRKTPDKL